MTDIASKHRGRFAPSPTGPLHFGSLVAAVASYLQARHHHGDWLVRIEDVDEPRCDEASTRQILEALESYGMQHDGEIIYQSRRNTYYQDAINELFRLGKAYDCGCSRKEIADAGETGIDGFIYPGTCRNGLPVDKQARSIRARVDVGDITFIDQVQGHLQQELARDSGDFIIRRADGLFAYQLAVVVDDAEQEITEITRGSDMLDSTPRQIWLQQQLGYSMPAYAHIPIAVNQDGQKLSKQNLAPPIDTNEPRPALIDALRFLRQSPPTDLRDSSLDDIWQWAVNNWQLDAIPAVRAISCEATNDQP